MGPHVPHVARRRGRFEGHYLPTGPCFLAPSAARAGPKSRDTRIFFGGGREEYNTILCPPQQRRSPQRSACASGAKKYRSKQKVSSRPTRAREGGSAITKWRRAPPRRGAARPRLGPQRPCPHGPKMAAAPSGSRCGDPARAPALHPAVPPRARPRSPPHRLTCNCAMRANKGAAGLYIADVTAANEAEGPGCCAREEAGPRCWETKGGEGCEGLLFSRAELGLY